jgi:Na+/H+ antiporter NhaA
MALLSAAVVALVVASSSLGPAYQAFISTRVRIGSLENFLSMDVVT